MTKGGDIGVVNFMCAVILFGALWAVSETMNTRLDRIAVALEAEKQMDCTILGAGYRKTKEKPGTP